MYRVLLVDDEALIREAISENTKWNELGYELAGTCKNGREAKDFIEREQVDLLLTDICMPHMDGMELTKFVYEEHREIKVVIISGYDEFEYAKKAVKYQVAEYILKPITAVELSETLLKVREKLDEERLKKENIKRIRGGLRKQPSAYEGAVSEQPAGRKCTDGYIGREIGGLSDQAAGAQIYDCNGGG